MPVTSQHYTSCASANRESKIYKNNNFVIFSLTGRQYSIS